MSRYLGRLAVLIALSLPVEALAGDVHGPPGADGPVVVDIGFFLSDLTYVDDEQETFGFEGVLTMSWTDPRQAFDPVATGYDEKLFQGAYQLDEVFVGWRPQLILANESGQYDHQGALLRVRSDGRMTYVQEIAAVADTRMRLRRFPFDSQSFYAVFEVLGFDSHRVVLRPDPSTTGKWDDERHHVRIPQWSPPAVSAAIREFDPSYGGANDAPATAFVLRVEMARESAYILRLVILPVAVLVMLSWSVFWMDRSSLGDRMDISFLGILTVVAFQITVSGQIPKISYLTVAGAFLNISFLTMCASVVVNLLVGRLDQRGQHALGDRVDARCRIAFPTTYLLALVVACGTVYLGG